MQRNFVPPEPPAPAPMPESLDPNAIPLDTPVEAAGWPFMTELFEALGLQMAGVVDARLGFDGTVVTLSITKVLTRRQGATAMALLQRRKYRVYLDARSVRNCRIPGGAPDQDFDPSPEHRPFPL